MKIQVTQTDIDNGIPRNSCFCPIAQSIKRQDKNRYDVAVGGFSAHYSVVGGPHLVELIMPEVAALFIAAFDDGLAVAPFEFEAQEY